MLDGHSLSEEQLAKVHEVATRYPQVVNLTQFQRDRAWEKMVLMDIKVVEFKNRDKVRELGVRWDDAMSGPSFGVAGDIKSQSASQRWRLPGEPAPGRQHCGHRRPSAPAGADAHLFRHHFGPQRPHQSDGAGRRRRRAGTAPTHHPQREAGWNSMSEARFPMRPSASSAPPTSLSAATASRSGSSRGSTGSARSSPT